MPGVALLVIGVVTGRGPRADHVNVRRAVPSTSAPGSAPTSAALGGPEVVNATQGAVSDAEARVWAGAFESSLRWSVWAVEHRRPDVVQLLATPGHADPHALQVIATAQAQHMELRYSEPPQLTRLLLVALSPAQQAAVAAAGGQPDAYAWLASYVGPLELSARSPGGAQTIDPILPAGSSVDQLSVGFLDADASLGSIWREGYSRDCSADRDASLCP